MSNCYGTLKFLLVLLAFIYAMLPIQAGSVFCFDAMVLLFLVFCFISPKNPPSLIFAWFVGLLQDILLGSQLGEHAFALSVTAFMCLVLLKRMQFFVLWQQVICVGCLTLIHQLIIALFEGGAGHFVSLIFYFSPVVMNMAIWVFLGYSFARHKQFSTVI